MITIFNRRELFITYSMERLAAIWQALEDSGIDYNYRLRRHDPGKLSVEYKVYVKRKDYDRAKYAAGL